MGSLVGSIALMTALCSTGGIFFNRDPYNHVLPPQPGYGIGFENGNPDRYGYVEIGDRIPLSADRTPEYYFRRYGSIPTSQLFMPGYFNPYISRGQRFIPFAGCGGAHPMGGQPAASAMQPIHPYRETLNEAPRTTVPAFTGRVEATPVNPGTTGLRP